jgi:nucleotidyltransferase/DNA polymerase involved in DNA repair
VNLKAGANGRGDQPNADGAKGDRRSIEPPRSLSDIPGLGPIRIRALQKAGWASVSALRSADLDALLAVPGLTEIKARQIHDYLTEFAPEELAASAAPSEATGAARGATADGLSPDAAAGAAEVVQRATRAMGEVVTVLLSAEAPQFRSRFLRVLGQFAQCAESLATDATHLSPDQQARAIRRLRRGARALADFSDAGSGAADRKAQGRLADALEELTAKLAECRLT